MKIEDETCLLTIQKVETILPLALCACNEAELARPFNDSVDNTMGKSVDITTHIVYF